MPEMIVLDYPFRSDVEVLFNAVRDLPSPIWFDSGKPRSLQGRLDIISAAPARILETRGNATLIRDSEGNSQTSTACPFALCQEAVDDFALTGDKLTELPFVGGLAGFFGYGLGSTPAADEHKGPADMPDMRQCYYLWALVINQQISQAHLVFHPACPASLRRDIQARLASPAPLANSNIALTSDFQASTTRRDYEADVARVKHYITAGDCYQVNYAQHFSAQFKGEPWAAYLHLRKALPSPFSTYLSWDDKAILSLSPERFIKTSGQQVEAKPIKGTITRGISVEEDQEQAIALMNSSKDRAENLMIVDLLRNDLGKSCEPGSIRVPKLFNLESFANVHHLVSTVTGRIRKEVSSLDLLAGCFPGGSITGAPKKRAMEIIAELEKVPRSIYCGSIGYISANGRMDTNIAIRTLLAESNTLHCWGGGAIVSDSHADSEYLESLAKVSLLMETLANL
ncbi:MAG: aminodeoxychorismate synthase component I [Gammaproteobacteria bacterium]|nr:aminodeoxychorismate synthase component I [Gammaproteobacteria bacterium]MBQ0839035.1 aminodeoxychorismate synthase component I [Gammaproteobacteria bacterium]